MSHDTPRIAFVDNISRVLLCINQHTKFEVRRFTDFKDMFGQNSKKLVTWPWSRPVRGGLS